MCQAQRKLRKDARGSTAHTEDDEAPDPKPKAKPKAKSKAEGKAKAGPKSKPSEEPAEKPKPEDKDRACGMNLMPDALELEEESDLEKLLHRAEMVGERRGIKAPKAAVKRKLSFSDVDSDEEIGSGHHNEPSHAMANFLLHVWRMRAHPRTTCGMSCRRRRRLGVRPAPKQQ